MSADIVPIRPALDYVLDNQTAMAMDAATDVLRAAKPAIIMMQVIMRQSGPHYPEMRNALTALLSLSEQIADRQGPDCA